ncbi:hypothetical protein K7I13_12200 [Brucepastera parasyntrophica]|uniref:hypothetical protein n=1 Tax=Brucepastera parasyntrophica TaxID=2880008 RepID=UPI00210BD538|nr:hypothetical protein [Brucepastera parasyntrophica]ULQ59247.1 hypothetical protein K7I13_12200 [Brucepastera parasyntrophica]
MEEINLKDVVTVQMIAAVVDMDPDVVRMRIRRRDIKEVGRFGRVPVYKREVIPIIAKDMPRGRPKKKRLTPRNNQV